MLLSTGRSSIGRASAMWRAPGWSTPRKASASETSPSGPGTCGIASWWSRPPARSWKEHVIDMIGAPFWTACTRLVEKELPSRISSTAKRIGSVSSPGPHEVAVERVDGPRPVAVVEVAHGDAGGHDALGQDLSAEDAAMGHLLAAALEDPRRRGADRLGGVAPLDVRDGDVGRADVLEGQHLDEVVERGERARLGGGVCSHRTTLVAAPPRVRRVAALRPAVTPPWPAPSGARPAHRLRGAGRRRRSGSSGSR